MFNALKYLITLSVSDLWCVLCSSQHGKSSDLHKVFKLQSHGFQCFLLIGFRVKKAESK